MSTDTVTGEISIPGDAKTFSNATAYVILEDVSKLDAPSEVISKQVIKGITHDAGKQNQIKFRLPANVSNQKNKYSIKVLIDLDGDGQISLGDFITTSYNFVSVIDHSDMKIIVQQVK